MKTYILSFALIIFATLTSAQTIGILKNQTDAWGTHYTYAGEIRNSVANGMGMAIYPKAKAIKYVGHFETGLFDGSGTMLLENGLFVSGIWRKGKLNGEGANINSRNRLYIGNESNHTYNGEGILIYKDNKIVKGNFENDKLEGRAIVVWTKGESIGEFTYRNDIRNGMGYQIDVDENRFFEGEWGNDRWVKPGKVSFKSFLKNPPMVAESDSTHRLVGHVNSNKLLSDTGCYYNKATKTLYFGYFENGNFKDGIIIGDSTRFVGQLNDKGANGYCYNFSFNKFYTEGFYTDGLPNGDILDVDLAKKTVYYGRAVAGKYTGKGLFCNSANQMFSGDYKDGKFTGQGYRIDTTGRYIKGTWIDGKIQTATAITGSDGESINTAPTTMSEALSIILKDWVDDFENIKGADYNNDNFTALLSQEINEDPDNTSYQNSLIAIPGSIGHNVIGGDILDYNTIYAAKFIETTDFAKAKTTYNGMAQQLLAGRITNKKIFPVPVKLKGEISKVNSANEKTETVFSLDTDSRLYDDFHLWLTLEQINGKFIVLVRMGSVDNE